MAQVLAHRKIRQLAVVLAALVAAVAGGVRARVPAHGKTGPRGVVRAALAAAGAAGAPAPAAPAASARAHLGSELFTETGEHVFVLPLFVPARYVTIVAVGGSGGGLFD